VRVEDLDVTFWQTGTNPDQETSVMSRCCTVPFSRSRQVSAKPSSGSSYRNCR
jgi:hypothetical protein